MNDFLSRLVERNQSGRNKIRPRLGSLFEPALPAEMAETQSILPDAPATPPPSLPTLEAAPHQTASTPVQQTPGRATATLQQGQLPEPNLPQPIPPQSPAPEPVNADSSVIPPMQHEHLHRTVISKPAIPGLAATLPGSAPATDPSSTYPSPASETSLVQDPAGPGPQTPGAEQSAPPKAGAGQIVTDITPALPEATIRNAEEPPSLQPRLVADSISSGVITESISSLTVSPRREALHSTSLSADLPQPGITPRIQPLTSLTPPAPEPPTIQVTIGRIDVRAQMPERQQPLPERPRTRLQPALSLDDYLKQRGGSS